MYVCMSMCLSTQKQSMETLKQWLEIEITILQHRQKDDVYHHSLEKVDYLMTLLSMQKVGHTVEHGQ